jgi:putative ABC transport system permease protein
MFQDSTQHLATLDQVAEYHPSAANLVVGTLAERRAATEVSAAFFRVLGVKPLLGRDFGPEEDQPGQDSVVLISYRLWQEVFHGDVSVVGKSINLNGLTFSVIGVAPPGMEFPLHTDVWVPTIFDSNNYLREGTSVEISAIGRMSANGSLALAQAEIVGMAQNTSQYEHKTDETVAPKVKLLESQLTEKIRPALLMLNLAVVFVLLIMCANVAHLILVHTAARAGEIGVRLALGARPLLLAQEQLVTSMLLSISGGLLGIGLAIGGTSVLYRFAPSALGQTPAEVLAWPVVLYGFLAIIATGVLSGLAPAWFVFRRSPRVTAVLSRSFSSPAGWFYGKLVASEIALALILLVGAGVFLRTLTELNRRLFAYDTHGLLTFSLSPHGEKYVDFKSNVVRTAAINTLYGQILAGVQNLPGVISAAAISQPPINEKSDNVLALKPEGKPMQVIPGVEYLVSSTYFQTMGIRIVEGRVPGLSELRSEKIAVVSQDFAHQLWPQESAIGKRLMLPLHGPLLYRVIAVAANSYRRQQLGVSSPEMYLFIGQAYCPSVTFIVRTRQEPMLLLPFIQDTMRGIDRSQPIFSAQTMDQRIATQEASQRFALLVLAGFAAIAVLLAICGLYSAMSLNLKSRLHEIGVRMALGAARDSILRMLLLDSCRLAIPGICLGGFGAFLLVRSAAALVFQSSEVRFLDVIFIALLFFLSTLIAGYLAAKHAGHLDPSDLLRGN